MENLEDYIGEELKATFLTGVNESRGKMCSFKDIAVTFVSVIEDCQGLEDPESTNIVQESTRELVLYLELVRDFPEFARRQFDTQASYTDKRDYLYEQERLLRGK